MDIDSVLDSLTYAHCASRYGIGYDSIEILWSLSMNGSAKTKRIIDIEAFSVIESLDTYLLIPESDENRILDFISVDSLSSGRSVALSNVKWELRRGSATISISPPIRRDDKISYSIVEKLPRGFYAVNLIPEELTKQQPKYAYCGWYIDRPTRKVSLQVEFPESIKPEVFSVEVRYASTSGFPSPRLHYEESQRLSPVLTQEPKGSRVVLRLDIDYPVIGLIYILRWHPCPIAREGDQKFEELQDWVNSDQSYLTSIRQILIARFNKEELRTLIMDLGIDHDMLPGKSKAELARELVAYLARRKQLLELVKIGKRQRRDISWPEHPY